MASAYEEEPIVGAVTYIGAEVIRLGVVERRSAGRISLGDLPGGGKGLAERIVNESVKSGLDVRLSENILREK